MNMVSLTEFFDLLKSFYGDVETITQDRQDEICKVFHKKLPPVDNDFTRRFGERRKIDVASLPNKKDTIASMQERFIAVITTARQIVTSADKMGGSNFNWSTPQESTTSTVTPVSVSSTSSISNTSVTTPTPPIPRGVESIKQTMPRVAVTMNEAMHRCYTYGKFGHFRAKCCYHMNSMANNTHMSWAQSPSGIMWKEQGLSAFQPNVCILNTGVSYHTDTIAGGHDFVYPTEDISCPLYEDPPDPNAHNGSKGPPGGKYIYDPRTHDKSKDKKKQKKSKSPQVHFDEEFTTIVAALTPTDSTDYLKVIISLPTQTTSTGGTNPKIREKGQGTKGTKGTKTKSATPTTKTGDRDNGIRALAMIDSGCLAGDLINERVLNALNGRKYLRTGRPPKSDYIGKVKHGYYLRSKFLLPGSKFAETEKPSQQICYL